MSWMMEQFFVFFPPRGYVKLITDSNIPTARICHKCGVLGYGLL